LLATLHLFILILELNLVIKESLKNPSWNRLFHVYDAFKLGIPFKTIHELTFIDKWFLNQIEELVVLEKEIETHTLATLPKDLLVEAKQKGYADRQIAHLLRCLESEVYKLRGEMNIRRVYKLVDTCSAEFLYGVGGMGAACEVLSDGSLRFHRHVVRKATRLASNTGAQLREGTSKSSKLNIVSCLKFSAIGFAMKYQLLTSFLLGTFIPITVLYLIKHFA